MRHIRHKTLLESRQFAELGDLFLKAVCHAIEGACEGSDHVFPLLRNSLLKLSGSDFLAHLRCHANRTNHESHNDIGHRPDEQDESEAAEEESLLYEGECLLRIAGVVYEIELVKTSVRHGEKRPDCKRWPSVGERHRLPPHSIRAVVAFDRVLQLC